MIKRFFIILFISAVANYSFSQTFPKDLWHEGKLVLADDEEFEGLLKYDLERGVVQLDDGQKILTYGAKSIFYFKIFDTTVEAHREFYVLPYGLLTSYKTPVIFEVLVEGNLSLLCREKVSTKSVQTTSPYYYNTPTYQREVIVYDYYFLDRQGNITEYNMKKKELMQAVSARQSKVMEYVKSHRLKYDRRNDLVRIIAFYNALL